MNENKNEEKKVEKEGISSAKIFLYSNRQAVKQLLQAWLEIDFKKEIENI